MPVNLTVIIISHNEENNIEQSLRCVAGWAKDIVLVDSFSEDRTLEIAKNYGVRIFQRKFDDYSGQRNFALSECGVNTEWIFFLDADEWLTPELKIETESVVASNPKENGFLVKRRFYWRGRWIRRGYYPTWLLRLLRTGKARCENRSVNEHLEVDGEIGCLQNDFVDENHNGIDRWHLKHLRYAQLEAEELIKIRKLDSVARKLMRRNCGWKRWFQVVVWNRLPIYLRPWVYFFYRYFLRGGFLDGREGFTYHFLQALWFQMVIGMKLKVLRESDKVNELGSKT